MSQLFLTDFKKKYIKRKRKWWTTLHLLKVIMWLLSKTENRDFFLSNLNNNHTLIRKPESNCVVLYMFWNDRHVWKFSFLWMSFETVDQNSFAGAWITHRRTFWPLALKLWEGIEQRYSCIIPNTGTFIITYFFVQYGILYSHLIANSKFIIHQKMAHL